MKRLIVSKCKLTSMMCGVKLIEIRSCQELMDLLSMKKSFDELASGSKVQLVWACFEKRW